jgi:hypothetical protein
VRTGMALIIALGLLGMFLLVEPNALCTIKQANQLPDLVVEITGPSEAAAGENIGEQIKLTVKNIGKAPAPGSMGPLDGPNSYRIDLVISTDETVPPEFARYTEEYAEDVLLKGGRASRTDDLEPTLSKSYSIGGGLPADTPAGEYYICAQIDPGNKVAELNEKNNVSCFRIRIKLRE